MTSRKRLVWLSLVTLALFSLLIIQFYKIQIIEGEKWSRVATLQHRLIVTEPFKRGLFYSNTGIKPGHPANLQPFVIDVPMFHLYIDPSRLPPSLCAEMGSVLGDLLHISGEARVKLGAQFAKKSRSRKLAEWLSREKQDQILSWWQPFAKKHKLAANALFFTQEYKRSYPFGKLLGQVLHTVREERDSLTGQLIPTGGLELMLDEFLQGKEGKREILRSPRNPLETGKILSSPENGADVYLTINHALQAIAEEEICKGVQNANAKGGWAILMDPYTGEILALAQYPWFEPARYRHYFNDPILKEYTKVKAITDPYEPGSTMKPITLAIGLKANAELKRQGKKLLFDPLEKIAVAKGNFPGRSKPIKDTSQHYYLNMYMGLQKSSNIYMARLIQRVVEAMGEKWYRQQLHDIFGFGKKTGIELPAETVGLLPLPGKKHPNGRLEWSVPTPFSIAMGHNILVNSMQMMRAWGVLANGGMDVHPTLIRKIVKNGSAILLDNTAPERVKNWARLLEHEVVQEIVKATKYATKRGGSAPKADIYGYTEVGKTGTSEKIVDGVYSKKVHISTFIGFAPAKDPRFVLLIAIDEPEHRFVPGIGKYHMGGNCAAPVFREIGTRTLEYLGVEPDDPHGYPPGDPRYDRDKADWVKESLLMQELYREWNR